MCSLQGCCIDLWGRQVCVFMNIRASNMELKEQWLAGVCEGVIGRLYSVLSVPTLKREADSSTGSEELKLSSGGKRGHHLRKLKKLKG